MSRLYIKAKGARSMLTRTAVDNAFAKILYNFDGKDVAEGSMCLRADTNDDRSQVIYSLYFTNEHSGKTTEVGTWRVDQAHPRELVVPLKQPRLF